jgi:hypothetical protein
VWFSFATTTRINRQCWSLRTRPKDPLGGVSETTSETRLRAPSSAASRQDVQEQDRDHDDGHDYGDDRDGGGGDNHSPPVISLIWPLQTLSSERCGPRSGESLRESRKHHKIGVEHNPLQATDAKRGQAVLVLEPTELALDRTAPTVEGTLLRRAT